MLYSWTPVYRGLRNSGALAADRELPALERWIATMRQRPAVELAMTRYEGTALRVGRDVEAPLR